MSTTINKGSHVREIGGPLEVHYLVIREPVDDKTIIAHPYTGQVFQVSLDDYELAPAHSTPIIAAR